MSILDTSPFPFSDPKGKKLQQVMAGMYPDRNDALSFVGRFEVDPLEIPKPIAPLDLWHRLLERLAILGNVRAAVVAARDQFPHNEHASFLTALLAEVHEPVWWVDRAQQAGTSFSQLVSSFRYFLSAQKKFFMGLAVCLAAIGLLTVFIPDDELAIKLLYDGSTAKFISVRYDLKRPPSGGLEFQELRPAGDGFIRIAHRDIAEPPNVSLVVNEALLPPLFAGNDKKIVLRVDKLNYEEAGVPYWNKSRQLFLDVKVEFVAGK